MIAFNSKPLSRVSTLSMDADLNEEEIREIGNEEIVERVDQTPTVSVTVDTNEYADVKNLRYLVAKESGTITISSFDGPTTDIVVNVEEDLEFKRSAHINDAVPVGISYNFDVGGLATESFNLEGDNLTWYLGSKRVTRVFNGITSSGLDASGFFINVNPSDMTGVPFTTGWVPEKIYADGVVILQNTTIEQTGVIFSTGYDLTAHSGFIAGSGYIRVETAAAAALSNTGATNYRVVAYESGGQQTRLKNYSWGVTDSASSIGGISKGMIDIQLTTGSQLFPDTSGTTFLRCQTCSVDVDLSRETLEELGHDRAYEKTLTLPVPVNVTFNTLATDLEDFARFTGDDDITDNTEFTIAQFGKNATLRIAIFDSKDTVRGTTGTALKVLTVTGIDIASQSFGVDVGGNATQDFTGTTSNITISGAAIDQLMD